MQDGHPGGGGRTDPVSSKNWAMFDAVQPCFQFPNILATYLGI